MWVCRERGAPRIQQRACVVVMVAVLAALPAPARSTVGGSSTISAVGVAAAPAAGGLSGGAAIPAAAVASLTGLAAEAKRQQTPSCAVKNKGYSDLHVPTLNGGLTFDALECQQKCAANEKCLGFTYYVISTGCWLQGINGTMPPLEDIQGTWSGPKVCGSSNSGGEGPLGEALEWVKEVPEEAEEVAQEINDEAEDVLKSVEGVGGGGNNTNRTNETLLMEAEDGLEELEEVVKKNGFPLWIGGAFLVIVSIAYLFFGGGYDGAGRRFQCGALMSDGHNSLGSDSDTDQEKSEELPRTRSRFSSRGSR